MEDKEALYAQWLSGEISDEELRAAAGDEALEDLQRVIKSVDQWSMPSYDKERGYEKFKQKHHTKETKVRKMNWFLLSAAAASLLIFFYLGSIFLSNENDVLAARNGQNAQHAFEDGSEIWLNDGSSLEYNAKTWAKQRNINLSGEALFEVAKGNPFVVKTQHGNVRVLGTKFNVRAWGSNLYVECYEGKVRVTTENQETILVANESVNVVQGHMNEKQKISHTTPSWQNGTSRFYNEKLQDVFAEIERQYDVKVNSKATDRNFSGNFKHDNLANALRAICKPLGLNYTISDDQKEVVIE